MRDHDDPASQVAVHLAALAIATGRTDIIPADLTRDELEEAIDLANKLRQREVALEVRR